jgi:hypothetical protein
MVGITIVLTTGMAGVVMKKCDQILEGWLGACSFDCDEILILNQKIWVKRIKILINPQF